MTAMRGGRRSLMRSGLLSAFPDRAAPAGHVWCHLSKRRKTSTVSIRRRSSGSKVGTKVVDGSAGISGDQASQALPRCASRRPGSPGPLQRRALAMRDFNTTHSTSGARGMWAHSRNVADRRHALVDHLRSTGALAVSGRAGWKQLSFTAANGRNGDELAQHDQVFQFDLTAVFPLQDMVDLGHHDGEWLQPGKAYLRSRAATARRSPSGMV